RFCSLGAKTRASQVKFCPVIIGSSNSAKTNNRVRSNFYLTCSQIGDYFMGKKIVRTDNAPKPVGPYSQAVETGGVLYCSGQIALDPATNEIVPGGVTEHTIQIMKNIEAVL